MSEKDKVKPQEIRESIGHTRGSETFHEGQALMAKTGGVTLTHHDIQRQVTYPLRGNHTANLDSAPLASEPLGDAPDRYAISGAAGKIEVMKNGQVNVSVRYEGSEWQYSATPNGLVDRALGFGSHHATVAISGTYNQTGADLKEVKTQAAKVLGKLSDDLVKAGGQPLKFDEADPLSSQSVHGLISQVKDATKSRDR